MLSKRATFTFIFQTVNKLTADQLIGASTRTFRRHICLFNLMIFFSLVFALWWKQSYDSCIRTRIQPQFSFSFPSVPAQVQEDSRLARCLSVKVQKWNFLGWMTSFLLPWPTPTHFPPSRLRHQQHVDIKPLPCPSDVTCRLQPWSRQFIRSPYCRWRIIH